MSALYVAACHAYLMYAGLLPADQLEPSSRALWLGTSWLSFGRAAVAVFIVLSGYCLMLPVVQSSPDRVLQSTYWQFMARRA